MKHYKSYFATNLLVQISAALKCPGDLCRSWWTKLSCMQQLFVSDVISAQMIGLFHESGPLSGSKVAALHQQFDKVFIQVYLIDTKPQTYILITKETTDILDHMKDKHFSNVSWRLSVQITNNRRDRKTSNDIGHTQTRQQVSLNPLYGSEVKYLSERLSYHGC